MQTNFKISDQFMKIIKFLNFRVNFKSIIKFLFWEELILIVITLRLLFINQTTHLKPRQFNYHTKQP